MTACLLLTCEHAGNQVPREYQHLFVEADAVLQSHRGWDPGSFELADSFQRRFDAPLFAHHISRLVVEPNRSVGHRQLFSEFTKTLPRQERETIVQRYYLPHRQAVTDWVSRNLSHQNVVVHLSLHTFTPVLNGTTRTADVGLLYDPARTSEVGFCKTWRKLLRSRRPDLRVRRNYPYQGKSDGLTTTLRRLSDRYLGIELEINQQWASGEETAWTQLRHDLTESFLAALETM